MVKEKDLNLTEAILYIFELSQIYNVNLVLDFINKDSLFLTISNDTKVARMQFPIDDIKNIDFDILKDEIKSNILIMNDDLRDVELLN